MSTHVRIPPPEPFDFNFPHSWCSWVRRFERNRQASTLHEEEGKKQVKLRMYLLGSKGEDVLSSFNLTNEEVENYNVVVARFNTYFNVRTNVIYERAVFNRINQNDSDSVDDFITRLYSQVDKCRYGNLRDEMLRDRIVVGIKDKSLSEKLQLDSELTLERAVTQVRNAELVKLQQKELQESHHPKIVERVQSRPRNNSNSKRCPACGYECLKKQHRCPAVSARCYQCGKFGHFRRMCNVYVSSIERNETESVSDKGYFVGTLQNARAWDKPMATTNKLSRIRTLRRFAKLTR